MTSSGVAENIVCGTEKGCSSEIITWQMLEVRRQQERPEDTVDS